MDLNSASDHILVSVVIPTFNRPAQLLEVLKCLVKQTFNTRNIEVVVIDDGSSMSYEPIMNHLWPFILKYYRQYNQGEVVARNIGVNSSVGSFLTFLDDDILVGSGYIEELFKEHLTFPNAILLGALYLKLDSNGSAFQKAMGSQIGSFQSGEVSFTECTSGVMAVGNDVYENVGGMRPLGNGGRNAWGGMDFAYRAHRAGYRIRRCDKAIAYHNDYALRSLNTYCKRMYSVSRLAVLHFQRYPELQSAVPMFLDKASIVWGLDTPHLIARKLARRVSASRLVLWGLEKLIFLLERFNILLALLRVLYRWIIGAYIFRGFRYGIYEFGPVVSKHGH